MDITRADKQQNGLNKMTGQQTLQLQRQLSMEDLIGGFQTAISPTSAEIEKSNQAKRMKLSTIVSTDSKMAGLDNQASHQP
jgi:hypothetical protein